MLKVMPIAQGWEYERHSDFIQVLNSSYLATSYVCVRLLRGIPNELHGNYYRRKQHLDGGMVGRDLDSTAELLDLLQPLAE